jgi:DNA-binding response OmpR family regulator
MENKILIFEDQNRDLTDKIASCLIEQGYTIETATNVSDAQTKISQFQPELIILGKVTPEDVYHICYQFRKTADAFILMIGTVGGGAAWAQSVDAGADFYLVHPFGYSEFTARVKSLLRRHGSSSGKSNIRAARKRTKKHTTTLGASS